MTVPCCATAPSSATCQKRNAPQGDGCTSPNTRGLYPAGEGAGYAGGILSAAVDGIKVADALVLSMLRKRQQA
jgi:uncharacterized FAD-dependent dehydrogenase